MEDLLSKQKDINNENIEEIKNLLSKIDNMEKLEKEREKKMELDRIKNKVIYKKLIINNFMYCR